MHTHIKEKSVEHCKALFWRSTLTWTLYFLWAEFTPKSSTYVSHYHHHHPHSLRRLTFRRLHFCGYTSSYITLTMALKEGEFSTWHYWAYIARYCIYHSNKLLSCVPTLRAGVVWVWLLLQVGECWGSCVVCLWCVGLPFHPHTGPAPCKAAPHRLVEKRTGGYGDHEDLHNFNVCSITHI